jgi:hypothetical protein
MGEQISIIEINSTSELEEVAQIYVRDVAARNAQNGFANIAMTAYLMTRFESWEDVERLLMSDVVHDMTKQAADRVHEHVDRSDRPVPKHGPVTYFDMMLEVAQSPRIKKRFLEDIRDNAISQTKSDIADTVGIWEDLVESGKESINPLIDENLQKKIVQYDQIRFISDGLKLLCSLLEINTRGFLGFDINGKYDPDVGNDYLTPNDEDGYEIECKSGVKVVTNDMLCGLFSDIKERLEGSDLDSILSHAYEVLSNEISFHREFGKKKKLEKGNKDGSHKPSLSIGMFQILIFPKLFNKKMNERLQDDEFEAYEEFKDFFGDYDFNG